MIATKDPPPKLTVADQLRRFADWVEERGIGLGDIVSIGLNSVAGPQLHLEETAARRVFAGRSVEITKDGHCRFMDGDVDVCFIEDSHGKDRTVTL